MRRIASVMILFFAQLTGIFAQLSIDAASTAYVVSFDNTLAGVNNNTYQGSGLQPSPASGQLDGDAWEIIGTASGDHLFGETHLSGAFARGSSNGGVSTSGLYAFEVASGDYAFGFQPSGSTFSPGDIKLKIHNNTSSFIVNLHVSYELWVKNDQNRSSSVDFSWSYENGNWHNVAAASYSSPAAAVSGAPWSLDMNPDLNLGVIIPPGSEFFIRWTVDDVSGSGSRDEFALDDIRIEAAVEGNPLIISEIMADPEVDGSGNTLSEPDAEWFEVFNNSNYSLDINGLDLEDNSGSHTVSGAPLINSGDYYVLGRADGSLNGPYTSDYIYSNLYFSNSGDLILIRYPDASLIDSVDFRTWSVPAGASLYFAGTPADDNNLQVNWSTAGNRELTYTGSSALADKGSPGTGGSGQILPLLITRFAGRFTGQRVELYWQLESTEGIEYFEVESSIDGREFRKRGEVMAVENQFRYTFSFPESELSEIYLRLRQVERTTASFYSEVIYLKNERAPFWEVFPNPAKDRICVRSSEAGADASYGIFDVSGRLLQSARLSNDCIKIGFLPSGLYLMKIYQPGGSFNIYFVKH